MGECFKFSCPVCGYAAEVSGGRDSGEGHCTQTILCFDCKELMDVVAAVLSGFEKPGMELTGESEENLLLVRIKCQRGSNHNWREWNAPDVCPRCGNSMELGHRIKFGINLSVCAEGRARRGVCEHEPRSLPRRARRERVSLVALARGAAYEIMGM